MPRNRSVRLAVLGSSVQRSQPASYSSRSTSALRRRIVLGVLVVLSLALLTVYFRESRNGSLHDLQSAGASALRPFEIGATRVARPFRDLGGWVSGLEHARADASRLRAEVGALQQQVAAGQVALAENQQLKQALDYIQGPRFPRDYRGIAVAVIVRAPSQFEQVVGIAAGSDSGIRLHDPVVTADGLVGQVTKVARSTAQVTLLSDQSSAVSALDVATGASGIARHGEGSSGALLLDRVTKDQVVNEGDPIVTSGWRSGDLSSIYPKGIRIGVVTSVGQVDTNLYKQVQVQPYVDFESLQSVIVLVPKAKR